MTKTLTIWRHAKAEEKQTGQADQERHLTETGKAHAKHLGQYLRDNALPDYVLCSPAARTRETLAALGDPLPPTELIGGLYLASGPDLLAVIHQTDDANNHLMIVGHNPGLKQLTDHLITAAETNAEPMLPKLREKLPTGGLVRIHLDVPSWANIAPGMGILQDYVTPESLGIK